LNVARIIPGALLAGVSALPVAAAAAPRPPPRPPVIVAGLCGGVAYAAPLPAPVCSVCSPNGKPGCRMKIRCLLSAVHIGDVSKSTLGDIYLTNRVATSYTMMKL
jgi:hypothetical protein